MVTACRLPSVLLCVPFDDASAALTSPSLCGVVFALVNDYNCSPFSHFCFPSFHFSVRSLLPFLSFLPSLPPVVPAFNPSISPSVYTSPIFPFPSFLPLISHLLLPPPRSFASPTCPSLCFLLFLSSFVLLFLSFIPPSSLLSSLLGTSFPPSHHLSVH